MDDDGKADDLENADIKRSLWHDATTAGGSSGGPLFTSRGVLVGLHYGSLTRAKGQGIAVPPAVLTAVLKKAQLGASVKLIDVEGLTSNPPGFDPKRVTVFVDVFGEGRGRKQTPSVGKDLVQLRASIEARIKDRLPALTDKDFQELVEGDLKAIYGPSRAGEIKQGQIVRIKSNVTVIQILDEGFLTEIDGVLCKLVIPEFDGRELLRKIGSDIIRNVPVDRVYVVGEPTDYVTVKGTKGSYIPLLPAAFLYKPETLREVFAAEKDSAAPSPRRPKRRSVKKRLRGWHGLNRQRK